VNTIPVIPANTVNNPYDAMAYIVLAGLCILGWMLLMVILISLGICSQDKGNPAQITADQITADQITADQITADRGGESVETKVIVESAGG
jgi:hypothetical protein